MSEHQLTIILGRIKKILINVSNNFFTSFYSSTLNAINVLLKVKGNSDNETSLFLAASKSKKYDLILTPFYL